jgi:hypothetical protein
MPCASRRIPAVRVSRAARRYLSRRRAPRRTPNPSRLRRENRSPVRHQPAGGEGDVKGGEGEIGAARGSADRREDRSRPWEEPDPPGTTTSPTSSTSPTPRRRLPLLPPRWQAAPPHYTDACTSASGHRGEDNRFSPLVVAPAIEPRRNARCSAPPRSPLVMPAFVPSWDVISCRCHYLRQRALARWLNSFLSPSYAAPYRS